MDKFEIDYMNTSEKTNSRADHAVVHIGLQVARGLLVESNWRTAFTKPEDADNFMNDLENDDISWMRLSAARQASS